MSTALTKTIAAGLAAVALATAFSAFSTEAQARPHGWGVGLGVGLAAGALIGAAAASSVYAGPAYVVAPGYRCRYVARYDAFGYYVGTQKICDIY
jgi:hypothetical protein